MGLRMKYRMGEIRDYMEEMQKKKGREMEQNG